MRILFAILLFIHGFAHLVGFLVPWRLLESEEVSYKTTILSGRLDLGDRGIRAVGVVWLLLALGMAVASFGVWTAAPWSRWWLFVVTPASLAACLVSLPEAKFGVGVNVAFLGALVVASRVSWLAFLVG